MPTPEEIQNITPAEFYEKYWKIQTKDGLISPPSLSAREKEWMNEAFKGNETGIYFFRKRRPQLYLDLDYLKEEYKKLPEFIKSIQTVKK